MFTSRDPNRGRSTITQGLRPHWLRLVLLLLLVAVAIFFPPIGNQLGVIAFPLKPPPIGGSLPLVPQNQAELPEPPPIGGSLPPVPQNQAEVRAAIERANSAFRTAHARADLAALGDVATGAWLDEERSAIAELQASGTTERWTTQSFELLDLIVRETTATACTDENWERRIVDAAGVSARPSFGTISNSTRWCGWGRSGWSARSIMIQSNAIRVLEI